MACERIGNMIVTYTPQDMCKRLHVGNRYIHMEFHKYCGPSFAYDADFRKPYYPKDENDPVWPEFEKWFKKYRQAQEATQ